MKFKWILLLVVGIILLLSSLIIACDSTDKEVNNYADKLFDNLNKEVDANNNFISVYDNANFETQESISAFRKLIADHLEKLNSLQLFYYYPCPNQAPQSLKDTVTYAKEGTTKVISGIYSIDFALSSSSNSQFKSGQSTLNDGIDILNKATASYNTYADTINSQSSGRSPNLGEGILIGTGILWILGLFVVNPLAKYFSRRQFALEYIDGNSPTTEQELSELMNKTFTKTYILTDVIVLGTAGFVMGLVVGWYFIGISWRARDWPGLLTFIGSSFLGSFIHG